MTRAVLDACVPYSAALRDLFMRLTVALVFQPVWTEQIHAEWIRNVLENRPDLTRAQLERTRDLMNRYGRGWEAPGYEALIPLLVLPDEDDRHVLAAAIAANALVIVTYNLVDFPASTLAPHGIESLHPDDFLCRQSDQAPERFGEAVQALLAGLKHPPRTLAEELNILRAQGLKQIAQRLNAPEDTPVPSKDADA